MIINHFSSMLKFLGFSIFDVGVFLSFEVLKMLKIAFSIYSTFDENALPINWFYIYIYIYIYIE